MALLFMLSWQFFCRKNRPKQSVIKRVTKKRVNKLPVQPVQIPFQTRKSVINLPTPKTSIIKIVNDSIANKSAFEFSFMKDNKA